MNKVNLSIKLLLIVVLFSATSYVFALGTWNTGYKSTAGGNTTTATNKVNIFDNIIVDNNYGLNLFTPTKTIGEWKSMWDNISSSANLWTNKEIFVNQTINASVHKYAQNNEYQCDAGGVADVTRTWSVYNRNYNIIEINSPVTIEGYLNMRLELESSQTNENFKLFLQVDGQATATKAHLIDIYDDGGSSGLNGPDLDVNNDGTNDIYTISVSDPGGNGWVNVKIPNKIKLYAGINYIRMEGYPYKCTSGYGIADSGSVRYTPPSASGEGHIWFSNH